MKDGKNGKKSEDTNDDDRYSWRKYCGAGYYYNVYPENYKTYDDYELALMREIHAKGDEDKWARKSGNPAGKPASGQNTGFTRNTTPGVNTCRKSTRPGQTSGSSANPDSARNEGSTDNPGKPATGTGGKKARKVRSQSH